MPTDELHKDTSKIDYRRGFFPPRHKSYNKGLIKMVDWTKWKTTGKCFSELIYLMYYVREQGIKEYDYNFTFAYGYELLERRNKP